MAKCWLYGHTFHKAHSSDAAWGELTAPRHDGIGAAHRDLYARCARCGKQVLIAKTIDAVTSLPPAKLGGEPG